MVKVIRTPVREGESETKKTTEATRLSVCRVGSACLDQNGNDDLVNKQASQNDNFVKRETNTGGNAQPMCLAGTAITQYQVGT